MKVIFKTESFSFEGEFNNSPAAKKILENLPIESEVNTWGDEIYFDIDISAPADGQTMEVGIGDIGYWTEGKCLCVFFGPTLASRSNLPVPASHVVIIGKTNAEPEILRKIKDAERITVSI